MGRFWAEVGSAALNFIGLVAVAGFGVFLGIKIRMHKNARAAK
ncbi:MAG: hypothetical protein PUC65_12075 [Clostridiales bacterium]|nr:hypothetical protein [Clostridiales bacterium]